MHAGARADMLMVTPRMIRLDDVTADCCVTSDCYVIQICLVRPAASTSHGSHRTGNGAPAAAAAEARGRPRDCGDCHILRLVHLTCGSFSSCTPPSPRRSPRQMPLHDTIRLMSSMHSNSDLATLRWPAVVAQTPYAKKLAKDLGVDLAAIAGSGPAGRITASDVEAARNGGDPAPPGT